MLERATNNIANRCRPSATHATPSLVPILIYGDDNNDNEQALSALKLEAPIVSKVVGWRLSHEISIRRPAPGAAASNASVKFLTTCKASFRVRGADATTDWKPAEAASSGVGAGAWATYSAHTTVAVEFKIQPEAAAAAVAPGESCLDSAGAVVGASGMELEEGAAGVVLEWKGAGWFKGFCVYHLVEVA